MTDSYISISRITLATLFKSLKKRSGSSIDYRILEAFTERPGRAISSPELVRFVYGTSLKAPLYATDCIRHTIRRFRQCGLNIKTLPHRRGYIYIPRWLEESGQQYVLGFMLPATQPPSRKWPRRQRPPHKGASSSSHQRGSKSKTNTSSSEQTAQPPAPSPQTTRS